MELKERIAKILYDDDFRIKPAWKDATNEWKSCEYRQAEAIVPIIDEQVKAERERIANALLVGVEIHEVTKDHLVKYANRLKRGE